MSGEGRAQRILITRPANTTAYSASDGIGNAPANQPSGAADCRLEFTKLLTPGVPFLIMSATLEYHVVALPVGFTATLELYNALPTAVADNAAWDFVSGDRGRHVGSINFGAPVDRGSTLKVELDSLNKAILTGATRSLFGILVTPAGFTPAGNSETLAVTLAGAPL